MTESETYWLSFVKDLVGVTQPLRGDFKLEDEPAWVTKLTCELFNMMTPKIQFRAGMRPAADKVGAIIGSQFVQMEQAARFRELPKPQAGPLLDAFNKGMQLGMPPEGFDVQAFHQNMPAVRDKIVSTITRILKQRPLEEIREFFRGFSRALSQNERSLIPEFKDGRFHHTPEQVELARRVNVYLFVRHNWRELDQLETSQQAFEWLEKRLPQEILGNDPERIRKCSIA
jgi:hypothetical protein